MEKKLQENCAKSYQECMVGIKPKIGNFNFFGRIVFKRAKRCLYIYKLLCVNDKSDGLDNS